MGGKFWPHPWAGLGWPESGEADLFWVGLWGDSVSQEDCWREGKLWTPRGTTGNKLGLCYFSTYGILEELLSLSLRLRPTSRWELQGGRFQLSDFVNSNHLSCP